MNPKKRTCPRTDGFGVSYGSPDLTCSLWLGHRRENERLRNWGLPHAHTHTLGLVEAFLSSVCCRPAAAAVSYCCGASRFTATLLIEKEVPSCACEAPCGRPCAPSRCLTLGILKVFTVSICCRPPAAAVAYSYGASRFTATLLIEKEVPSSGVPMAPAPGSPATHGATRLAHSTVEPKNLLPVGQIVPNTCLSFDACTTSITWQPSFLHSCDQLT